jgi:50S ribosomal subunit-associated GTPase HflX
MPLMVAAGQPQAGKTLVVAVVAEALGQRRLLTAETARLVTVADLRRAILAGRRPLEPVTATITVGRGPGRRPQPWIFTDSVGLVDPAPADPEQRKRLAETLDRLQRADLVLHVVDAARLGRRPGHRWDPVDQALRDYAETRPAYVLVASKMDRSEAPRGFRLLRRLAPDVTVFPVAAATGQGVRELARFLREVQRAGPVP